MLPGTRICELPEVRTPAEDTAFIITVPAKFYDVITESLRGHGFGNYTIWDSECLNRLWKLADYDFTDRRKYGGKCCFILAGYKEFLWEDVFERFTRFMPADIDVCILSSGMHSGRLEKIAEENSWSYLSTKVNSVTLIQNVAFAVYNEYEWIYKLDEDMFVTEGAFEKLYSNYRRAQNISCYEPGIMAPLIPVNGYGYSRILNRIGKTEEYERNFKKVNIGGNPDSEIEKNPETAVFMWKNCPQIDKLNRIFANETEIDVCSVRLSIGFILLKHSFWEDMQGFSVSGNTDMGTDEEELCAQCMNKSKSIMVSTNTVVGHFAFGRQTGRMKEFYEENPGWFKVNGGEYGKKRCERGILQKRTVMELDKEYSAAICGFRKKGRELYDCLLQKGVHIPYIVERNYEALSLLEKKRGVPVVGFDENMEFYGQADVIILSGDLPEDVIRECFELAGIEMPVIKNELE